MIGLQRLNLRCEIPLSNVRFNRNLRCHPEVRGGGDRLKQVVLNLLSNAIKFTPGLTAGGEVEVRTEMASETKDNHVIKISVRDTGRDFQSSTF